MAYITILRPLNCIITAGAVWVGAWIGRGFTLSSSLILAGIIGFLTCGFGNIVNDLYDIEIDRVNNPGRPLPSGRVQKTWVILLAVCLFTVSMVLALWIKLIVCLLVLFVSAMLFMYAAYFKKTIIANTIISIITGMSFLLGGIITHNILCIFPFIFSFFIHMPREIIKDIIDIDGDRQNNVSSIPIVIGTEKASVISAFFIGILCMLLPLPFVLKILSVRYITIALLFAYPFLLYCLVRLLKKPSPEEFSNLSRFLKIAMAGGLVAMVI